MCQNNKGFLICKPIFSSISSWTYIWYQLLVQLVSCAITNHPVCLIGGGVVSGGGVLGVVDRLLTCKSYVYTVKQKSQKTL